MNNDRKKNKFLGKKKIKLKLKSKNTNSADKDRMNKLKKLPNQNTKLKNTHNKNSNYLFERDKNFFSVNNLNGFSSLIMRKNITSSLNNNVLLDQLQNKQINNLSNNSYNENISLSSKNIITHNFFNNNNNKLKNNYHIKEICNSNNNDLYNSFDYKTNQLHNINSQRSSIKNENKGFNNLFKGPNPLNLNNINTNDFSTVISDNGNLIRRNLSNSNNNINENNLIITKNKFLSLLEFNKDEYKLNFGIDLDTDKNLQNIKENSIMSLNSDLNVLHSDLFLYTKFENSKPYKLLEYIMSNNDSGSSLGANQYSNSTTLNNYNNLNNPNTFNNNQFINKNFLRSNVDQELYEEIKKTIFNKPKCFLTEPKSFIQKTLFQYIKSDFTNSNIIKIFDKCNSKIEKHFKAGVNCNPFVKDKFTYQNILLEKLKDNYNNDLLLEINDTDMLKSLIYIVNKNNKVGYKFKKQGFNSAMISNSAIGNNFKKKEEKNENALSENLSEEININYINNPFNVNNSNKCNNGFFLQTLKINLSFLSNSLQEFQHQSNSNRHSDMYDELNKDNLTSELEFEKKKISVLENNYNKDKTELLRRIKKALFYDNKSKGMDLCQNCDKENRIINKNEETKVSENNNTSESGRLKKFIYRKMRCLVNDDNKKTVVILKSLKNKEQNIKLFCKILELFCKCREDDFEKILKKMKDYLCGIDLDLVDNLDKILKVFKLDNIENESKIKINQESFSENINLENNLYSNNHLYISNEKQKIIPDTIYEEENGEYKNNADIENENVRKFYNAKKKNHDHNLNRKNNLVKNLLNIKAFWVNFRLLFSMINILEKKSENSLQKLTDEKFWKIIFNYIANKDYKIGKTKLNKMKLKTDKNQNNTELFENKEICIINIEKKTKKKNPTDTDQDLKEKHDENKGIVVQKRKYIRTKLRNQPKKKMDNQNNNNNESKDENLMNCSENKIPNILNMNYSKDEFFRNTNKEILYNEKGEGIQDIKFTKEEKGKKGKSVKEKTNDVQKKDVQQQKTLDKELRKNLRKSKKNTKELQQLIENSEEKPNKNNKEEFKSKSEVTLIDTECKEIILNRIKDKIPLFDIFTRNAKLLKKCFSNYNISYKKRLANKSSLKLNEKESVRNKAENEKKTRRHIIRNNIKKANEAEKQKADKTKSKRKPNVKSKNSLQSPDKIIRNENDKSIRDQDVLIDLVSPSNFFKNSNNFIEKESIKSEISEHLNPFNNILNNFGNKAFIHNNKNIYDMNSIGIEKEEHDERTVSDLSEVALTNSNMKISKNQKQIKIKGNVIINNYYNIFPTANISDPSQILNTFGRNTHTNILNNCVSTEKNISNNMSKLHNILIPVQAGNLNQISNNKLINERPIRTETVITSGNKRNNRKSNSSFISEETKIKLNGYDKKLKSEYIFNFSAENLNNEQDSNYRNKQIKPKNEMNVFSSPKQQQRNTRSGNKNEEIVELKPIIRPRKKKNEQ